ncbi:hypothetical protein [Methylocaldum sp.]|nr:hypothetical protein [Methylocaldum sp.]HYE38232.1 hypothetical protein [Methylocaldum sp.]
MDEKRIIDVKFRDVSTTPWWRNWHWDWRPMAGATIIALIGLLRHFAEK